MANHVLSKVVGAFRRSDYFHAPPESIIIVEGWNPRGPEYKFGLDDLDKDLIESVRENGVQEPLRVRKTKGNTLELVNGERRLSAVRAANASGAEILSVPVIVAPKASNDADLFFDSIIANDGRPISAIGESDAYTRLIGWGFTPAQIAKRVGKSLTHVKGRLGLASASPDVKQAVSDGEIPISAAQEIVKTSGGNMDAQAEKLEKKKNAPRAKNFVLSMKGGAIKKSGPDPACIALESLISDGNIRKELEAAGLDPDTIKITVKQAQ